MNRWSLLVLLFATVFSLKTLKNDTLNANYQIGLISDLYFRITDRIFFRSEDDLFGTISQENGSLLAVYELEDGERIVGFVEAVEVMIAKGKAINIFFPKQGNYQEMSFENTFLQKHPDYQQIIDYTRTIDMSIFILTDQYLMELPLTIDDLNHSRVKETILIELTGSEEFFALREFTDSQNNKQDYYLISLHPPTNITRDLCFRTVRKLNESARCVPIPNIPVEDVISSGTYIYISFAEYTMVMTNRLEFIQKIDWLPLQYFKGLISLGGVHQYYDPQLRTIYNTKIIVEHQSSLTEVRIITVKQNEFVVDSSDSQNATELVKIPKKKDESPRKVWSYTKDTSQPSFFILYIEYEDGRLVCYSIDGQKHSFRSLWQLATDSNNAGQDISQSDGV